MSVSLCLCPVCCYSHSKSNSRRLSGLHHSPAGRRRKPLPDRPGKTLSFVKIHDSHTQHAFTPRFSSRFKWASAKWGTRGAFSAGLRRIQSWFHRRSSGCRRLLPMNLSLPRRRRCYSIRLGRRSGQQACQGHSQPPRPTFLTHDLHT